MKNKFVNYFKNAESDVKNHKVGVEFEHFVLNNDLTAVSFFEEQGIEALLKELSKKGWAKVYEGEHLIGLKGENKAITLEPGGQLELTMIPFADIKEIERIYLDFLEEVSEILNSWNKKIAALGYQPESSIKKLPLLPKKRYDFMFKYFKNKGKYAHNMMKGTASVQMSIDYSSEKDYIKKLRVGYFLSPVIYYLFDNTPFFETKKAENASIRAEIWSNCDRQRSGTIKGLFDKEFSYNDYAEYLLNTPPIFKKDKNKLIYTGDKLLKDIINDLNTEKIEHFISMVFPDIRTKKYIEIRAADALPYPYNFSFVALFKNLFYNQKSLDYLYQKSLNYNQQKFLKFKSDIIKAKENNKRDNLINSVFQLAKKTASNYELKFIQKLEDSYLNSGPLKFKTLNNLNKGKAKALDWCLLN